VKRGNGLERRSPLKSDPAKTAAFVQRGRGKLEATPLTATRRDSARPRRSGPRAKGRCFCGCGEQAVHRHHCLTEQELRRVVFAGRSSRMALPAPDRDTLARLVSDPRNLVDAASTCHGSHHAASQRYSLAMLPDSVFEFAAEVLGERAHGWLRRRYVGEDARLDALREIEAA